MAMRDEDLERQTDSEWMDPSSAPTPPDASHPATLTTEPMQPDQEQSPELSDFPVTPPTPPEPISETPEPLVGAATEPASDPEPTTGVAERDVLEQPALPALTTSQTSDAAHAQRLDAPATGAATAVATPLLLDERILPLRMTPMRRPRRVRPLAWGGLIGAALMLLLPAMLASVLWPALGIPSPFGGPPDNIPRGASAWANATATTPLSADNDTFGEQTYPVDSQFTANYAARGGQSVLGPAITPAFTSNLGEVQFFASGALLRPASKQPTASVTAKDDLDPDLASDGDTDTASGVEWLPLTHTLLSDGSAAPIGGVKSSLTYATLRTATQAAALQPKPANTRQIKTNAPLPQTLLVGQGAFVVEGTRAGKLVGHSIPASTWSYINQAHVAPDGWLRDIGEPLTEPLDITATDSDGQQQHLIAQAFWQTIIVSDPADPQATTMQPIGLDYLHTIGAPNAHPSAGEHLWTTQDGALRNAPGASALAVSLNTNAAVSLTGAAQWNQGALWYAVTWSSPHRSGTAWSVADALTDTQPSGPTSAGFDALSPDLASYLSSQGDKVGAVVYDITRNTTYTYRPTQKFIMASSAKVPLMVSYLAYIEAQGRGPNGYEQGVLNAMIEQSDNNAAQVIYDTIGYDAGQQSYMHAWGIGDYSPDPNGWGWGQWSPADMAHLLTLLQSGKVLNSSDRALAFHLMTNIESDQRFGVGDTAPAGATVAMKDGWVPGPDGAWAVNTSGIVTVGKETYIITVYTREQNSFGSGEDIVNHVCGAVAKAIV